MMKSKYLLLFLAVSGSAFSMEYSSNSIELNEVSIDMPATDNMSRFEQLCESFPAIRIKNETQKEIVEEGLTNMSRERFTNLQNALGKTSKDKKRLMYSAIARSQAGKINNLKDDYTQLATTAKRDRNVLACSAVTLAVFVVYSGVVSLQCFA